MDIQSIAAIVFIFIMFLFFLNKRKKFKIQKIVGNIVYFGMYRTKAGLRLMDKIAIKGRKIVKWLSYFAIVIGFIGMILIAWNLFLNLYKSIFTPAIAPGVALVLPFKIKGGFYVPFFYWIISIFIIAVVHEFSHGVVARLYGMKIKSSGFAFLAVLVPIIPAAFVEPDEKELSKRSAKEQLGVFAAGPFSNIALAFIVLAIAGLVFNPILNNIIDNDGVVITGFTDDNSAAKKAGINENELILGIDDKDFNDLANFTELLLEKKPGESIELRTNVSSYNVILAENPEEKEKAYLGIFITQKTKVNEFAKERFGILIDILMWFAGLFYWLFLLNFGIGLFNLVPLGPIDGGRMLRTMLMQLFDEVRADRIWKFVSSVFLLLILANLAIGFF